MGQYYRAYLEKDSENYEVWKSLHAEAKLMEAVLIERDFTSSVMMRLLDSPHLAAFIGDYGGDDGDAFGPFSHDEYMLRYRRVWKDKNEKKVESLSQVSSQMEKAFIVNNTKKCFINMEDYSKNVWRDGWGSCHSYCVRERKRRW